MSLHVFLLTGAGVSAESGLGTFRDVGGLWSRYDLSEVASIGGYLRNPKLVLDFYNERRRGLKTAEPNPAHAAIAQLEAGLEAAGGSLFLCTQNVDDLHERAGARRVVHMHGELSKARCEGCGSIWIEAGDLEVATPCLRCGRVGEVRPHIVWFGEEPFHMDEIHAALAAADLFVAAGTSGAVYPAAGFVSAARAAGVATMELNLEPSDNASVFAARRYGKASEIVPAFVAETLARLTPCSSV